MNKAMMALTTTAGYNKYNNNTLTAEEKANNAMLAAKRAARKAVK